MTGSVREDGFASSGSTDMSPEQRVPEWGGDQLADPAGADLDGDLLGIDPTELTDDDLIREMHSLHRTRLDTLRHAADSRTRQPPAAHRRARNRVPGPPPGPRGRPQPAAGRLMAARAVRGMSAPPEVVFNTATDPARASAWLPEPLRGDGARRGDQR